MAHATHANAALTPRSRPADRQLSRRELDVLHLLAEKTDREIAEALFLSRRTVNWHVRAILAKLGAAPLQQALTEAATRLAAAEKALAAAQEAVATLDREHDGRLVLGGLGGHGQL